MAPAISPFGQSQNSFKNFIQVIITTSRARWMMKNFIAIFFFLTDEEVKVDWFASLSWNYNNRQMIRFSEGLDCEASILG